MLGYVLILVYIYLYKCCCITTDETLDILDPHDDCIGYVYVAHHLTYYSYNPSYNRAIRRIVDGNVIIWENDEEGANVIDATFHENDVKHGLIIIYFYAPSMGTCVVRFRRNEGIWESLNSDEFLVLLSAMEAERTLNINHNNDLIPSTRISTKFNNARNVYNPKNSNYIIVQVNVNDDVVWKREQEDHKVSHLTIYDRRGDYRLMYMEITNDVNTTKLQYIKVNGEWKKISCAEYLRARQLISNESSLDILIYSSSEEYNVVEHQQEPVTSRIYTEDSSVYTTEVVEGDNIIWESPDGRDKFTMAVVHFINYRPLLTHVSIKTYQRTAEDLFYKRTDLGQWVRIENEEFDILLQNYANV